MCLASSLLTQIALASAWYGWSRGWSAPILLNSWHSLILGQWPLQPQLDLFLLPKWLRSTHSETISTQVSTSAVILSMRLFQLGSCITVLISYKIPADLQPPKRRVTVRRLDSTTLGAMAPWGVTRSEQLSQRHTELKINLTGSEVESNINLVRILIAALNFQRPNENGLRFYITLLHLWTIFSWRRLLLCLALGNGLRWWFLWLLSVAFYDHQEDHYPVTTLTGVRCSWCLQEVGFVLPLETAGHHATTCCWSRNNFAQINQFVDFQSGSFSSLLSKGFRVSGRGLQHLPTSSI